MFKKPSKKQLMDRVAELESELKSAQDKPGPVSFYSKTVQKKKGDKMVTVDVPYIRIVINQGLTEQVSDRPAKEEDKIKYASEWASFEAK